MEKKFEMREDALVATITQGDKLFLPLKEGKKEIGTYTQVTTQIIDKDKAKDLKAFIELEKKKAQEQIDGITAQLEKVKDAVDIDEQVMDAAKKAIDKGSKNFKERMKPLNEAILKLTQKKQFTMQLEYINKQMEQVNSDLDKLNAVL